MIGSHTIASVPVGLWGTNFLGLGFGTRVIDKVTFSGDFEVLDKLTFQAVPEPSSIVLIGLGAVGLFLTKRRRRKGKLTT